MSKWYLDINAQSQTPFEAFGSVLLLHIPKNKADSQAVLWRG
jgi:hypothetical protein